MKTRGSLPLSPEFGLVLLLGVLWGSPYALTKIGLETIKPMTLVTTRVALAAAVLWLVVVAQKREVPKNWRFVSLLFIQGTISCVIPYTLITLGQQTVDSALAAVLNSTTPILLCLISVLWTRHETLTPSRMLGVALGFAGVVAVVGSGNPLAPGQHLLGQLAILAATISSAVSAIHGRRFAAVAPEVVSAGVLTAATLMLLPVCLFSEAVAPSAPSAASMLAVLINAVFGTALGFVIYFHLIRTAGTLSTTSASYLKPAVGVLIGCGLLGEPLSWVLVAGLLAIFVGIGAINTSPPRPYANLST
jgi:drug/metabolite transporter (DMT)-like permease